MSANNYISIDKKTFKVEMRDADTEAIFDSETGENLEDAIRIAQNMVEDTGEVEYGIWFKGGD